MGKGEENDVTAGEHVGFLHGCYCQQIYIYIRAQSAVVWEPPDIVHESDMHIAAAAATMATFLSSFLPSLAFALFAPDIGRILF
jgi:hypothetical protein